MVEITKVIGPNGHTNAQNGPNIRKNKKTQSKSCLYEYI